jgi:hypothetical protein
VIVEGTMVLDISVRAQECIMQGQGVEAEVGDDE